MNALGKLILPIYSTIIVLILIAKAIKRFEKKESKGLEVVALIPVLIFLINII